MRILVTGALGWIAKAIVETLHNAEHDVIGFDLPNVTPFTDTAHFTDLHTNTISDYDAVLGATQEVDAIVHLG